MATQPTRAGDLSSYSSDPSYVPSSSRKPSGSGGLSWFSKTFAKKSSSSHSNSSSSSSSSSSPATASSPSASPVDSHAQPAAPHPKKSSFAFWKKKDAALPGTIKAVRSPPPAAAPAVAIEAPPPVPSPVSHQHHHSHSNSQGVLYRPSIDGGPNYDPSLVDSGLSIPATTRSSSTGNATAATASAAVGTAPGLTSHLHNHSSSFSEADQPVQPAARDRSASLSQTAPGGSSSYYTSTYYSSALSNLTSFQPSSAYVSRQGSRRGSKSVTPGPGGSPPSPGLDESASPVPAPPAINTAELLPQRPPSAQSNGSNTPSGNSTPSLVPSPSSTSLPSAFAGATTSSSTSSSSSRSSQSMKLSNFRKHMWEEVLDMDLLRRSSWNGIPPLARSIAWKILLGYLPPNLSRREVTLRKRREEYRNYVTQYYDANCVSVERENPNDMDDSPYSTSLNNAAKPSSSDCVGTNGARAEPENDILRQIRQDVPRTAPGIPFFKLSRTQKSLERLLYIFSLRHPASGYVQGMNDLATPFYCVFLSEYLYPNAISSERSVGWEENDARFHSASRVELPFDSNNTCADVFHDPISSSIVLSATDYLDLEADVFGSLSLMVDKIQDNYTFAQPGIQRMVYRMKELVQRLDAGLDAHLEKQHVQYIHFGMRWMNCLLLREMPMWCIIRMWDTYLSEDSASTAPVTGTNSLLTSGGSAGSLNGSGAPGNANVTSSPQQEHYTGFRAFHIYMCTAFLMRFASELKTMAFQELVLYLQKLPTEKWGLKEVETLLAQAFIYKSWFHSSPHQLK